MSTTERSASAPPPSGGGPSLEAQVVRLGLMTPDEVATTMREEAETGRSFAELAVESGRLKAEDLAKLTGEAPKPPAEALPEADREPAPALTVEPDPEPEPPLALEPEPEPERLEEPMLAVAPEPESEPEPELEATPVTEEPSSATAEVFVCLTSGERVAAGSYDDQQAAEERARELMGALDDNGEWPRLDGRFIRPDAVVSIDVELDG